MSEEKKSDEKKFKTKKYILCTVLIFVFLCAASFGILTVFRARDFVKTQVPSLLSAQEQNLLSDYVRKTYPENFGILKTLPYNVSSPNLNVWAESFILIDVSTGYVLYEKDSEEIIPPASMTKLFAMYIVEEEVLNGNLSYSQEIFLPSECWACNMPPHSSLMFLGEGQHVTLEELLLGLSICSGNDAAYALAYTVCGSMEKFVERMNDVASSLGLTHTHFVESSGYSEENTTTASEMAAFCRYYIKNHPDSLHRFHSVLSFTYPEARNLADGDVIASQDFSNGIPRHITMPITQNNTNPLLGKLEGCDGLKTGYIEESGYNLSLTAVRDGSRFLSVTMKGPGSDSLEGQRGRVHDGSLLMEWAFSSFADYPLELKVHPYNIRSFGASQKMIRIVPVYEEENFTIPFAVSTSLQENLDSVRIEVTLPDCTFGEVSRGEELGKITIFIDNYKLKEIPLISDRDLKKTGFFASLSDKILEKYFVSHK